MSAFFLRRFWLIRNRLMTTLSILLLVPSLLTIVMVLGTKNIIVKSINGQPYELWVASGIMMFLSAVLISPLIYRDFFDLRIHNKALVPMTLAPLRKSTIILGIQLSALVEVMIVIIVSLGLYNFIFPGTVSLRSAMIILAYCALFSILYSNIIILLSLCTERISVFMSALLTTLIVVLFSSELIVEYGFFPVSLINVFEYLPLSMVSVACRSILFINSFDFLNTFLPVVIIIFLVALNSMLLKRKMKQ